MLVLLKHLMKAVRVSPWETKAEQGKAAFLKISQEDKNPRKTNPGLQRGALAIR